jgi:hypothetical protein
MNWMIANPKLRFAQVGGFIGRGLIHKANLLRFFGEIETQQPPSPLERPSLIFSINSTVAL